MVVRQTVRKSVAIASDGFPDLFASVLFEKRLAKATNTVESVYFNAPHKNSFTRLRFVYAHNLFSLRRTGCLPTVQHWLNPA